MFVLIRNTGSTMATLTLRANWRAVIFWFFGLQRKCFLDGGFDNFADVVNVLDWRVVNHPAMFLHNRVNVGWCFHFFLAFRLGRGVPQMGQNLKY